MKRKTRKCNNNAIPAHHSERVKRKRCGRKRKARDFYLLNMTGSVKAVLLQSLNQIWLEQETAVLQCLLKRGSSFIYLFILVMHPIWLVTL